MENPNIKIVESYIHALRDSDLSAVPFAEDVLFEEPLIQPLNGKEAVLEYLPNVLPLIKDVKIKQHIADGEYVATLWDAETPVGLIPVCECFRVVGGQLKEIKAYFDPRSLTNPAT
ncbi:MAG: nuclear transport factor 2 family protein [Acidobacteria bacterium]|nr:nuclear transport factor 2 family protein [Acidobacteriota bacterium]